MSSGSSKFAICRSLAGLAPKNAGLGAKNCYLRPKTAGLGDNFVVFLRTAPRPLRQASFTQQLGCYQMKKGGQMTAFNSIEKELCKVHQSCLRRLRKLNGYEIGGREKIILARFIDNPHHASPSRLLIWQDLINSPQMQRRRIVIVLDANRKLSLAFQLLNRRSP